MSGSIRLFVPVPLCAGAMVPASAGQAHYLGTVMRCGVGDVVRLFNGEDGEWSAHVAELRRNAAIFRVDTRLRPQTPEADVWLLFALLKRDATDLVVQKATELGVAAIHPVLTARTNAHRVNLDRLRAIAIEAAEQSERLTVPVIHEPRSLAAVLESWPNTRRLLVAAERVVAPPVAPSVAPSVAVERQSVALLIGPEGGFTASELDVLRAHPLVALASLGNLILRAETAAIVGLARLQA